MMYKKSVQFMANSHGYVLATAFACPAITATPTAVETMALAYESASSHGN